jgi:Tol biopolymer transport system component
MGDVYRARDARLGREVAIKVIAASLATDASRLRRFEQEARAAGQINHPNILSVYDVGVHEGTPYLVSELLEGESLRSHLGQGFGADAHLRQGSGAHGRLQGRALPARKAIEWARQAAEGLAAAHDKGIVHRDVKPDNLFITSDGRLKILDFGIAKLTLPSEGTATGYPTDTAAGTVVGTVGYMSPEQVRGDSVDARSDIFSVGTVLYEMLTGRAPFARDTAADSMAAILKEEPADMPPADVPPALARIVSRCLEKTREARFQSARDLAFGLDVLSGTHATTAAAAGEPSTRRARALMGGAALAVLSVSIAIAIWVTRTGKPAPATAPPDPLTDATYSRFTDWPGTEAGAEISPDGRFVAFISDRDGEFDLFVSQVGTGNYTNLTLDLPPLRPTGVLLRTFGFSGDGSEIWFSSSGDPAGPKLLIPIAGGTPQPFLGPGDVAPAWSPDGTRLAYFNNRDGDPLFVAGRMGGDPRQIYVAAKGEHIHNPVWSPDGEWIYFVHGPEATTDMDVWRIRPSGGTPDRLTHQNAAMSFLTSVDARTVFFVSRANDGSGPWLWSLDVPTRLTRRVSSVDPYTYVSASRERRRVVAAVARRTSSLWRVPVRDRPAEDRDVTPYPLPVERGLAPRFAGSVLFFLSGRGTGDGLWRLDAGQLSQVWNPVDGALSEPAVPSRDGKRVAVVVRREGKRHLMIVSADGTNPRTAAASIDIQGAAGQAALDWSPDGAWIVAGGTDAQGAGLFKVPADGGTAVRIIPGYAVNPVWSPDGQLILYAGPFVAGQSNLLGVRPDSTLVEMPKVRVRPGAYRFLPGGKQVLYLPSRDSLGFWLLDLETRHTRVLTALGNHGVLSTFDLTADGTHIVFDRTRDNADVVRIDLRK